MSFIDYWKLAFDWTLIALNFKFYVRSYYSNWSQASGRLELTSAIIPVLHAKRLTKWTNQPERKTFSQRTDLLAILYKTSKQLCYWVLPSWCFQRGNKDRDNLLTVSILLVFPTLALILDRLSSLYYTIFRTCIKSCNEDCLHEVKYLNYNGCKLLRNEKWIEISHNSDLNGSLEIAVG